MAFNEMARLQFERDEELGVRMHPDECSTLRPGGVRLPRRNVEHPPGGYPYFLVGPSSNCGLSSRISNQGALEPVKM